MIGGNDFHNAPRHRILPSATLPDGWGVRLIDGAHWHIDAPARTSGDPYELVGSLKRRMDGTWSLNVLHNVVPVPAKLHDKPQRAVDELVAWYEHMRAGIPGYPADQTEPDEPLYVSLDALRILKERDKGRG